MTRRQFYIIGFLVLMCFDTMAQICFKYAGTYALPLDFDLAWFSRLFSKPWVYGSILGYLGAFVAWMSLLKYAPVGPSFAASHLELVSVTLFSVWLFDEPLNTPKVIGGTLIILGVLCLARSEGKEADAGQDKSAELELPPTAGLPLAAHDFIRKPSRSFVHGLQEWPGLPDPVLTCSGTAALIIALKTLHKMHPGRTGVIIPAYTCPLVLMAVRLVPGLRPIICDTRLGGFDLDAQALAEHCNSETLAIVPAHLGGRVADIATVREIAQKRGAFVLEDAAQALGAFNQGVSVGLEGDIGFFSLAVGKGLTTYEGGILFSRHPELAAALKATARETLRLNLLLNCRRFIELAAYTLLYSTTRLKYVYGRKLKRELAKNNEVEAVGDFFTTADIHLHSLDSLRLRVAGNALERLPEFLEQGRIRAEKRLEYLSGLAGVDVITDRPDASGGTKGVWPFFMLLLPGKEQRDSALAKLWTKGLGVSKLFAHALPDYAYLHEPSAAHIGRTFDCVNARDFSSRMLTISNTHWMDEKTFALIAQEVRSVL